MNAPAGLDLASISERVQSEVQRAIQRSIKGVEYIASTGPSLGSTPKTFSPSAHREPLSLSADRG
jgi:polyhydroxyalkanoate synthase